MLHVEDIVEEIDTKRHGELDSTGNPDGTQLRVRFTDGRNPPVKYFDSEEELRLISCPHGDPEGSGFIPDHPLIKPE
jgi:hypothetical protein